MTDDRSTDVRTHHDDPDVTHAPETPPPEEQHTAEKYPCGGGPRVSRRAVLKGIGVGAAAVVLVGAGGVSIRALTNGVFDSGDGAPYDLWATWGSQPGVRAIVAAGVLAANPHNIQPWVFTVSDTTIDLYGDPRRVMPINDSDGRERMVGFGCAIENMVCAARNSGLDPVITPFPDGDPGHIAHLDVRHGRPPTGTERALAAAIGLRHSNRGPYESRALDMNDLHQLDGPVSSEQSGFAPGSPTATTTPPQIVWIADEPRRRALGELYVHATQAIIDDEQMSKESFAWFRNDRHAIDSHRDGLTLDGQGLTPMMLTAAKLLPAQSRESGDTFWLKTTREVHTATAAAYGIVRVGDVGSPLDRLAGGRLLQHVHLVATAHHLGLQHMNQITERIARDGSLSRPNRFGPAWSDIIGIPANQGLVSFRVGYPERTASSSPRRTLSDVVETR